MREEGDVLGDIEGLAAAKTDDCAGERRQLPENRDGALKAYRRHGLALFHLDAFRSQGSGHAIDERRNQILAIEQDNPAKIVAPRVDAHAIQRARFDPHQTRDGGLPGSQHATGESLKQSAKLSMLNRGRAGHRK